MQVSEASLCCPPGTSSHAVLSSRPTRTTWDYPADGAGGVASSASCRVGGVWQKQALFYLQKASEKNQPLRPPETQPSPEPPLPGTVQTQHRHGHCRRPGSPQQRGDGVSGSLCAHGVRLRSVSRALGPGGTPDRWVSPTGRTTSQRPLVQTTSTRRPDVSQHLHFQILLPHSAASFRGLSLPRSSGQRGRSY